MEHLKSYDRSLFITKFSLFMSGINIYPLKWNNFVTLSLKFLFYINIFWLHMDSIAEVYWLFEGLRIGKSISEISVTAPCTTMCFLATAKCAPLFFNSKLLKESVSKLRELQFKVIEKEVLREKEDHNNSLKEITKRNFNDNGIEIENRITQNESAAVVISKIMKEATKFLFTVTYVLFISSVVVLIVFCFSPMMLMCYELFTKGETDLLFPFLATYFFNPTKSLWIYGFMYFHQTYSTLIAVFNVFGTDSLLYAFCNYIQMHFKILCYKCENFVTDSEEETRVNLNNCIKRHQELIELVKQIEKLYSKSTLFNILSSSLLICLSGFNVTFAEDKSTLFAYVTFLSTIMWQILLLCLFGDMMMQTSAKLAESIYKSRWYDTNNKIRKSVVIIIIRSQKPCKLTAANFSNLNLSAFTTILSRSWSYFALLKTMYN